MLIKILILSICLNFALCWPNGAPIEACETLTPVHGLNQPNPADMPIEVLLESNVVQAGQLMSVSLRVRNDTMFGPSLTFRGFIIQARVQGSNAPGRATGTFELTAGARHVPCPTLGANAVVTHTINNDKTYLQLLWRAPVNIFEPFITVNFYYSIVWMVPVFWTNAISATVTVQNPAFMEHHYANNL